MRSKQLELGNIAERSMAKFFQGMGYWCHVFSKSQSGSQPVDLIALRGYGGVVDLWLCDVKNVEESNASFPFSRIEPNQESTLRYARDFAHLTGDNCHLGFIVVFDRDKEHPRYFDFSDLPKMRQNSSSANIDTLICVSEIIKKKEKI
jgi:hypothetical protein